MRWSRSALVGAIVVLLISVAACAAGPGPAPASSTAGASSSAGSTWGPEYRLSGGLCDVADLRPLKEIYPDEDLGFALRANEDDQCDLLLRGGSRRLTVNISAEVQDPILMDDDPMLTARRHDISRTVALYPAVDIGGVGSGAYWSGNGSDDTTLQTYDGNINLRIHVFAFMAGPDPEDALDPDMLDRIVAVAVGSLHNLESTGAR